MNHDGSIPEAMPNALNIYFLRRIAARSRRARLSFDDATKMLRALGCGPDAGEQLRAVLRRLVEPPTTED